MTPIDPAPAPSWRPTVPRPRLVRPYTLTAGRTQAEVDLPIEATLRRLGFDGEPAPDGPSAADPRGLRHASRWPRSAALVKMPIGVVRVLLGDLVQEGKCASRPP